MNPKRIRIGWMFLFLFLLPGTSFSAPATPPDYKTLRYDEDYSYLSDPANRGDLWDTVKYIPLQQQNYPDWYLSLGGEARERYEYFHNYNWGKGPQDRNGYFLQRYMLHNDFHLGKSIRAFVQVKSGIESGREGGPRPTDEDKLDLNQAFMDWNILGDTDFKLRVGRQEMQYGSSRLISVRESPNVHQTFDGVKFISKIADWKVDGFFTHPVKTRIGVFDDGQDKKREFWGTYATHNFPLIKNTDIDIYYLGLRQSNSAFDQGTQDELRHSLGMRFWGKSEPWDYNFESVYQFGSFGEGQINAWTAASDTSFTFKDLRFTPRLGLKADIISGDRNPRTQDLQTFNPLFPKGAYFGEVGLIGPANLMDLHPSLDFRFSKDMTV